MNKTLFHVHCHLCVLKNRCEFSACDESYKFQHWDGEGKYPLSREENEKLEKATLNCPLKKLVEENLKGEAEK